MKGDNLKQARTREHVAESEVVAIFDFVSEIWLHHDEKTKESRSRRHIYLKLSIGADVPAHAIIATMMPFIPNCACGSGHQYNALPCCIASCQATT